MGGDGDCLTHPIPKNPVGFRDPAQWLGVCVCVWGGYLDWPGGPAGSLVSVWATLILHLSGPQARDSPDRRRLYHWVQGPRTDP